METSEIEVSVITVRDNLTALVGQINRAVWDEANDLSTYTESALRAYLERQDTIFLACHRMVPKNPILLGIASGRIEMRPYDHERWLYVDEVDVCADQRQRGAGKQLMRTLISIANAEGCHELWLGTEVDNHPANALYKSLKPDEVCTFVGYAYEFNK